ncbi:MAG: oligosaccharide flippase family protein [Clostridium sp.]
MNNLFKKFLEFAMGNGIVLAISIISTPIVTRLISEEEYGKNSLFVMISSLIVLVTMLGCDQAYIRYFNEEEPEKRGALLKKIIRIPLGINIIVSIIICLSYKYISSYIIGKESIGVVLLLIIHTSSMIISNFAMIHIRMKQNAKKYSILSITSKVSYIIIVCLLYNMYLDSYKVLIFALVISNMLMVLLAILSEKQDFYDIKEDKRIKTSTKEIITYGAPFIFSMSIIWIFQSIDKITIKSMIGNEALGIYAGAMTIVNILGVVQGAFTTFWTPVAYQRYSENPENKDFFVEINKIVSLVMLILSIIVIASKDLIIYFLGSSYKEAKYIIPFLVFMPIMYTISETTVIGINFNKKSKYHIVIGLFSALSNILGNLILVPVIGVQGAAISTGLAYVIFFLARTYYSNKFYKINFKLKRFAVSTLLIYAIAIYSSFNEFNIIILMGCSIVTIITLMLYRDIILKFYKSIRGKRV